MPLRRSFPPAGTRQKLAGAELNMQDLPDLPRIIIGSHSPVKYR